ncbi:fibronectin type III domain-containing protein [Spirosoma rhododendri]|uniref:Fibronectin type-III domain-containing protein n=1 Tax=Spirosoma rhododendri TaxID=2728024 RepID=A0A7L5DSJ4_9BACT|nr:hypothetical protein [Spirosoma rhododendri]QJD80223.1 hypothetical protein HH216_18720 [Spirosoma rhododendri]
MKSVCLLVLLIGLSGASLLAQRPQRQAAPTTTRPAAGSATARADTHFELSAIGRAFGDSVVVRWAPHSVILFREINRNGGYILTRRSLGADGRLHLDFQKDVRGWTLDEWKQRSPRTDSLAAACAQLAHGKNSVLKSANDAVTLDKLVQQKTQDDFQLMLLLLLLADENARHAEGLGLGYIDRAVKKGTQYFYYLTPRYDGRFLSVDEQKVMVSNVGSYVRPPMPSVRAEQLDKIVRLVWDRQVSDELFSAYYVERSADGGRTYRRLNRLPYTQAPVQSEQALYSYVDSLQRNYVRYQYRVVGISPFGERSVPSPVITAQGIDLTPPTAARNVQAKHLGGSKVRITWEQSALPSDFAGYIIARGNDEKSPVSPLTKQVLGKTVREYIDETANPYGKTFYKVVALDTAKNASPSMAAYCTFKDVTGPAKPKNVQGYIDTTGYVRLVWDPNAEPDLLGYAVLMANQRDHVFTNRTSDYLPTSVYDDQTTLSTLTKKLYYRVVAYDKNYNPSPPPDILELARPDKVPPSSPVISDFVASDTAIVVRWTPSISQDVQEQVLYRRGAATENWRELAKLTPQQDSYADQQVKPDAPYSYMLMAVDSAGLASPASFPLNCQYVTGYSPVGPAVGGAGRGRWSNGSVALATPRSVRPLHHLPGDGCQFAALVRVRQPRTDIH